MDYGYETRVTLLIAKKDIILFPRGTKEIDFDTEFSLSNHIASFSPLSCLQTSGVFPKFERTKRFFIV